MVGSVRHVESACPSCHKSFLTAVDLSDISPGRLVEAPQHQEEKPEMPDIDAIIDKKLKEREPKEPEKPPKIEEKPKVKGIPPYVKKYKCKSCNKLHDNEDYVGPMIGKCDTCGTPFTTKSKGKCPYCKPGEIEPVDPSEVEDMEMYDEDEDD